MSAAAAEGAERPNVLVFFTDQQRWDTCGCYGSPMDLTPNLDRLAREGVLLRHAFTPQPLCAPARACLQTGQYATTHGVWRNEIPLGPDARTLAHSFREHGYATGYIGKWHLANTRTEPVPPELRGGYEHWEAADILEFFSQPYATRLYNNDDEILELEGYRVDALTDRAIRFIRQARDEPFLLVLSHLEPHHQNDMHRYVAPDGYAERYKNPYVPPDLVDRPGDWHAELPDYYGIVRRLDECLGRLMEALEEAGLADNTVVLFLSDHGSHFRTRNREYKRSCHESSIRVPAVLWGPGFSGPPREELVSLLDLPPTLLEAAGIQVPGRMEGRSLMPLLRGRLKPGRWLDEVFVQLSEVATGRALRTRRWKYGVVALPEDDRGDGSADRYFEWHLYDLAADPWERVNLAGSRAHQEVAEHLRERLLDWIGGVEGVTPRIERPPHPME